MKLNDHIVGSNAGTGEWYVDTPENSFATKPQAEWFAMSGESVSEDEAIMEIADMSQKLETAKAIVKAIQSLAPATDTNQDLVAEYFDAGTFVDADVAALGITAAQLASCITLLEQVGKLMTNQETTEAMYRTTLNAVRRVTV